MATKLKQIPGVKTTDMYKAPLSQFVIEEGFNVRDLSKPSTLQKIEEMAQCFKDGRPLPPLEIYLGDDNALIVNDGHCRLSAARLAEQRGWVPADFQLCFYPVRGNTADRIASMLRSGSIDDPLTALEIADGYRRLRGLNFTPSDIARMVSKSPNHVADMLLLADAEPELHARVRSGQTAGSTVIAAVKELGHQQATVAIRDAVEVASSMGKDKVMPKHIRIAFEQKALAGEVEDTEGEEHTGRVDGEVAADAASPEAAPAPAPTSSAPRPARAPASRGAKPLTGVPKPLNSVLMRLKQEALKHQEDDSQLPMAERSFTISGELMEALLAWAPK